MSPDIGVEMLYFPHTQINSVILVHLDLTREAIWFFY